ncbi:hypothetical protein G4X40_08730 [Rhodococcus sp. D2-41]|uniref:hypothetical protein n=1 Tax=Speluncibacter jeojiensis TaxID=2710754 RepID=UPI00240F7480|nr:hypothetical protein [Rhodococcus sp. D2-41]MDG3010235.1 hypothetical protein [Rhodococcus sp. D2-41]
MTDLDPPAVPRPALAQIGAAWRQCRTTVVAALSAIGVLVAVAVVAGIFARRSGARTDFGGMCSRWYDGRGGCRPETALTLTGILALVLPVLLGAVVGVTTFSRRRVDHSSTPSFRAWYLARVLTVFVPISLAMTALGLALGWARPDSTRPIRDYDAPRLEYPQFEISGLVTGGYTFLALMVGSTLALLLRRTVLPIMLTLIVMPIVLIALPLAIRPHYAPALTERQALNAADRYEWSGWGDQLDHDGGWVIGGGYADAQGRTVDVRYSACSGMLASTDSRHRAQAFDDCLRAQGADHYEVRYHRDSRYWRFQLTETALVLTLAGLLTVPALWAARRVRAASDLQRTHSRSSDDDSEPKKRHQE